MPDSEAPALKHIFDEKRFRSIAALLEQIHPGFSTQRFLERSLRGLNDLSLLQRLRRLTESMRATLPADYEESLEILRRLAPRLDHRFVTLCLPDFVGLYGLHDFETSMEALKFFTTFGSSEFAVREYLRRDLRRSLQVMEKWSRDENEDVRRLASEGCRPRLPWSFRLEALIAEPALTLPILENLRADSSLYVRKSVANHLNDITKDHPEWVLDVVQGWPLEQAHTAWIVKRALRTLIKKGNRRALGLFGAGKKPKVTVKKFAVQPSRIRFGRSARPFLSAGIKILKGPAVGDRLRDSLRQKIGRGFTQSFQIEGIDAGRRRNRLDSPPAKHPRFYDARSSCRPARTRTRDQWRKSGVGIF
jgi:3-methyladenine DNA glycosylase AlkC